MHVKAPSSGRFHCMANSQQQRQWKRNAWRCYRTKPHHCRGVAGGRCLPSARGLCLMLRLEPFVNSVLQASYQLWTVKSRHEPSSLVGHAPFPAHPAQGFTRHSLWLTIHLPSALVCSRSQSTNTSCLLCDSCLPFLLLLTH